MRLLFGKSCAADGKRFDFRLVIQWINYLLMFAALLYIADEVTRLNRAFRRYQRIRNRKAAGKALVKAAESHKMGGFNSNDTSPGAGLAGVDKMYSLSMRDFMKQMYQAHNGEKGNRTGPCGCYDEARPSIAEDDGWSSCRDPKVYNRVRPSVPAGASSLGNVTSADSDTRHHQIATSFHGLRRVVAYSLFTYNDYDPIPTLYIRGLHLNALQAAELYPGWDVRVYFARKPLEETEDLQHVCAHLCYLREIHPNLQLCDATSFAVRPLGDVNPMMWRFLPMVDRTVGAFISRDLDSLIEKREAAAVTDWLQNTDKTLHVMRDHQFHFTQILGGMWGMRRDAAGNDTEKDKANLERNRLLFMKMLRVSGPRQEKGRDQKVLSRVIWPHFLRINDFTDHSSHFCGSFSRNWRPFPTERNRSSLVPYVGAAIVGQPAHKFSVHQCPYRCRPHNHKEWQFC